MARRITSRREESRIRAATPSCCSHARSVSRGSSSTPQHDRPLTDAERSAARELVQRRGQAGAARLRSRRLGLPAADAQDRPPRARPASRDRARSSNGASSCSTAPSRRASSTSARAAVRSPSRSHRNARTLACMRPTSRRTRSRLAAENAEANGLSVEFRQGDLLAGLAGPFDLVVSNPPYVEADELESLEPEVREWEPRGALVDDGQTARLVREAEQVLAGWLVLEVHEARAQAVSARAGTSRGIRASASPTTWPGKSESWRRGGGRPRRPRDRRGSGGPAGAVPDRHRLRARGRARIARSTRRACTG